jgi:dTDP-4-amino-4,6-dideoxygalactose transaminase
MITIQFIKSTVEDYFNLPPGSIDLKTQERKIVERRQIAQFLAKQLTDLTNKEIAFSIGNKDHSTIDHSVKTINNLIDSDKKMKSDIDEIIKRLNDSGYRLRQIKSQIISLSSEYFGETSLQKKLIENIFCCD